MTALRTLVFADREPATWGAFWLPGQGASAPLACQRDGSSAILTASLGPGGPGEAWRLEGDSVSLTFTPSGGPANASVAQDAVASDEQLCTVSGSVTVEGARCEIDCLGWRTAFDDTLELTEVETFRQTYGWFDADDGLALAAFRPRRARGHDTDLIAAALVEPAPAPPLAEPRLSSTYDAEGMLKRVGLEVWFETEESDDEGEADADRPILRRAAGEALAQPLRWEVDGFGIGAVPIRWHSRGEDGGGVYLLGQRG